MKNILIIEDDPAILAGLEACFHAEHYDVDAESDGARGYERASKMHPDIFILDLMLPSKNGEEIRCDLRADKIASPNLMLTSKVTETDKVLGLELGRTTT